MDEQQKTLETEMGTNRFFLIVDKPFKGRVDTFEMDVYKYGPVRSFASYLKFSGITFEDGKTDTKSCDQLHWVPYENATDVEVLLDHKWTLLPKTTSPAAIAAPKVTTAAATKSTATKTRDPNLADGEEDPLPQDHDTHAKHGGGQGGGDVIDDRKPVVIDQKLRQEAGGKGGAAAAQPVSGATMFFFCVIVVLALFVYANDDVWRVVSRQFRSKNSASHK